MNTWKVVFATMVIFAAGVVTGGLVVRHSERINAPRPVRVANPRPPSMSAGVMKIEFLRRAERELDLDQSQRRQIDKIISASQERTRKILEPVSPNLREELQHTREEFRAVLTPEQRSRFEELIKQQQRPREPRRPARPPLDNSSLPSPNASPAREP